MICCCVFCIVVLGFSRDACGSVLIIVLWFCSHYSFLAGWEATSQFVCEIGPLMAVVWRAGNEATLAEFNIVIGCAGRDSVLYFVADIEQCFPRDACC